LPTNVQLAALLWYQAQSSAVGIEISTNNPVSAITTLHQARKKLDDEKLWHFSVRRSPLEPESKIWLIRTKSRNEVLGRPEVDLDNLDL
jgi:hypothetical protein